MRFMKLAATALLALAVAGPAAAQGYHHRQDRGGGHHSWQQHGGGHQGWGRHNFYRQDRGHGWSNGYAHGRHDDHGHHGRHG